MKLSVDPHIITQSCTCTLAIPVFEAMASLPRSMTSSLIALPRSCHDLGKDAMPMQDRAKANHDPGKDAMINHVRDKDAMINHVVDKGSMVPNPFFW